jgi:hypothetical protein
LIHELLWAKRITGTGDHIADTLTAIPGTDFAALKRVFARALADRPDARFETALEFVDALKNAFPDVTIKEPVGRKKVSRRPTELEPQLPLDAPQHDVPLAPIAPPRHLKQRRRRSMPARWTFLPAKTRVSSRSKLRQHHCTGRHRPDP